MDLDDRSDKADLDDGRTMAAVLLTKECRIEGLQSRPEMNGTVGRAVDYSSKRGRYIIELADAAERVAIKASNLVDVVAEAKFAAAQERIAAAHVVRDRRMAWLYSHVDHHPSSRAPLPRSFAPSPLPGSALSRSSPRRAPQPERCSAR